MRKCTLVLEHLILLVQWKVSFEISEKVGSIDYKTRVKRGNDMV